jgi:hypothetical protein
MSRNTPLSFPVPEDQNVEMVLWTNPTSKFFSRLRCSRVLSLGASLYSDVVVATDLNQSAVACFIAQKQTLMPIQAEDRQQRGQSPEG